MDAGPVSDHRKRENGLLVYPVYSRRSKGLSIGINLFPDRKVCPFDCPYCEVFPFGTEYGFSLDGMKAGLADALIHAKKQGIAVRDICFSGNGEPSVSPHFPAALEAAFRIRDRDVPDAELVLITNGCGLLDSAVFDLLHRAANGDQFTAEGRGLHIWLKLDAGTLTWYKAMNRSSVSYEALVEKIKAFAGCAPFTLQTMVCAVNGEAPSREEGRAWEALVAEIALSAKSLREVQIYGKARPAPEDPLASPLPDSFLDARAESLRNVLANAGRDVAVRVY